MNYKLKPSKIIDFWSILGLSLATVVTIGISLFFSSTTFAVLAVVSAICIVFKSMSSTSPIYIISDGQLKIEDGTWLKKEEFIELFRVQDISTSSFFLFNWFKIGKITLITNDKTCPKVEMKYIKNYKNMAKKIRQEVLKARKENNIQEIDLE